MRTLMTGGAILALAGAAAADTITVPGQQPTIQAAVNAAQAGDTIAVSAGVYKENVTSALDGLVFKGMGAVIDGNIAGVDGANLTITGNGVTVQGFTFRNGDDQLTITGADAKVTKCVFIDAGNDGLVHSGTNGSVSSCRFLGAFNNGIQGNGSDGLLILKNIFRQVGANGASITGNGVVATSNQFTNIEDTDGILINGTGAVVSRNKFTAISDEGIGIAGDTARVEKNKFTFIDGDAVVVSGNTAIVSTNKLSYINGRGVSVTGDTATVTSNKIAYTFNDGIDVAGDNATISLNTVRFTVDDEDGIRLTLNATGGGTIEGNRVDDAANNGFVITSNNVIVRGNSANRCGSDGQSGFLVVGDANTLENNTAVECDTAGFQVTGDTNQFDTCVSKKAFADGFRVNGGSDANVFDNCSATGSGGEGFDNRGTNTQLPRGTYLKNRIDIANDVIGGATILGGTTNVNFQTGGIGTQPEVD